MDAPTVQDPQRLLADLAAEYARSRRFLEELENNFVREPPPASPSGPASAPACNDEHHEEPSAALDHPAEAPSHAAVNSQPESAPSKLRSKLRSLFTRRAATFAARGEVSESGSETTVVRTASESQSAVSGRAFQRNSTFVEQRPIISVAASPPPRRASQIYYAASPADAPRAPCAARGDADVGRPATSRRSSVVYFGGEAMDSAGQGWVARVGGDPPADRPATGRRASVVYYGTSEPPPMAPELTARGGRMSADFTAAVAERPATARRASIVQFGDTIAVTGGGLGGGGASSGPGVGPGVADSDSASLRNGDGGPAGAAAGASPRRGPSVHFAATGGGGGGGALQDTTDPHEFMSAMAGPRRATSFHQRSGNALLPTSAQRLRSATTMSITRRASIEAYREPPPQQQQQQQLQQQQHQSSRASLEGRQVLLGAPSPDQQPPTAPARRTGSLEIARPFSAATARQHPAATAAAATAAPTTAVSIHNSALFAPASLAGSTASAATLAAAAATCGDGGAIRQEVPSSPQSPAGRGQAGPQLQPQPRLQQPNIGVAWAPPAAAAAAGLTAPADGAVALLASRGRVGGGPVAGGSGGAGIAALRSALSSSSKRLLDQAGGTPTAAPVGPAMAAAAAAMGQGGNAVGFGARGASNGRELGVSGTGMLEAAAAAVVAAPSPPVTVSVGAVLQAAAREAEAAPLSPSPSTSPTGTGGPRAVPLGVSYGRVPPPPPLQQPPQVPLQPPTPPQQSPQLHPPSQPSPPHQPRPPTRPYQQPPAALAIFRLRAFGGAMTADGAFLGGGGDGSGGEVPRAESPPGFELRFDERARSAAGCEGAVQPAM